MSILSASILRTKWLRILYHLLVELGDGIRDILELTDAPVEVTLVIVNVTRIARIAICIIQYHHIHKGSK